MTDKAIVEKMHEIVKEALAIGPWLCGNLLCSKKNKYTKKDGTISLYAAPAVLQYRVGPGAKPKFQRSSHRLSMHKYMIYKVISQSMCYISRPGYWAHFFAQQGASASSRE